MFDNNNIIKSSWRKAGKDKNGLFGDYIVYSRMIADTTIGLDYMYSSYP